MVARIFAALMFASTAFGLALPAVAQIGPFNCATLGTPEMEVGPGAGVESPADIDYAYLILQGVLATATGELALLAATDLEHPELTDFASSVVTATESDQTQLQAWIDELYPEAEPDPNALLAMVESAKMQLDLPAGEGGLEAFGSVVGVGLICTSEGPFDEIYLTSAIDASQQQIDLAQVAVTNASNEDIVAYATALIGRESLAISRLLTWQNEWFGESATPAS